MFGSIKYNFANIFNFDGREARQTFWFYMLFLFVLQVALGMIAAIPMYAEMATGAFGVAQAGGGEQDVQSAMLGKIGGMMKSQVLIAVVIGAIASILFSAAFVRRLHDSGKTGWWLLLVLVPYLGSLAFNLVNIDATIALTEEMMTMTDPDQQVALQSQLYRYSALGYLAYIPVIVFGIWKSDDGPNRYGEEPQRF